MLKRSLVLMLLGALSGSGCTPPIGTDPFPRERCEALPAALRERIDPFVTERMRQGHIPGLSLVILQGGQPVCLKGYGLADEAENRRMTAKTQVSIGSTTKAMTALALMQQVEAGAVDLEAPVTRYLPWFRTADGLQEQILVKHLLTHTSGLPMSYFWDGSQDDGALERRARSLAGVRLLFTPGQGEVYANDGFALVGLIVQTVAGKPFARHMADSVFTPLGMSHTRLGSVSAEAPDLAEGYVWTRGQLHPLSPPWSIAHEPAGAATYTSAEDVARYFSALLAGGEGPGGRVLSAEGVERMWQPLVIPTSGMGWVLSPQFGRRMVSHGGSTINSSSMFLLFPSEGTAVAVLSNLKTRVSEEVALGVAAMLFGDEPAPASPSKDRAPSTFVPDTGVWRDYVGSFDTAIGPVSIAMDEGRLWATFGMAQPEIRGELEAYGDNEFIERDDFGLLEGTKVSFQREPDGGLRLLFDGQSIGKRVP
ncbi:serine hydrolase domain-containing protein [Archangium lipolyticum]|uniref:serine hydrolase domain-containing protein n=1 Tax=Archangium lipolyticum TaxID=2970465 RepID=UPI00214A5722|nr:serine hydrolase domain-containing protein [Archangium lipolyticum]